jgi:uncharacterized protein
MKRLVAGLIHCYQVALSPLLGANCRFFPSCSEYARESILRHGVLHGGWFALRRLARCHPLHSGGYDPVPKIVKR